MAVVFVLMREERWLWRQQYVHLAAIDPGEVTFGMMLG